MKRIISGSTWLDDGQSSFIVLDVAMDTRLFWLFDFLDIVLGAPFSHGDLTDTHR